MVGRWEKGGGGEGWEKKGEGGEGWEKGEGGEGWEKGGGGEGWEGGRTWDGPKLSMANLWLPLPCIALIQPSQPGCQLPR